MAERHPPRHRWLKASIAVLGFLALLFFLATSSDPWVPDNRAATAEQVELGRETFLAARASREAGKPVPLQLGKAKLEALSAMATQGLAPNRLSVKVEDKALIVTASRPFLGRWINLRAVTIGRSKGFPDFRVTVGAIPIPSWLLKQVLGVGRRILVQRGIELPQLDELIASTSISKGTVVARVMLPAAGLMRQAVNNGAPVIDAGEVARIYCRLAADQNSDPDPLFAHQLRRALEQSNGTREGNGAALVALAMLTVNKQAGDLVGDAAEKAKDCVAPKGQLTLQGRTDSPKHWALSAALEVTTGSSFTAAMGEWKEQSDSLAKNPFLARNDRSGFSFVDLATDRAGAFIARKLLDPTRFEETRRKLLKADDEMLLPDAALSLTDGISDAEFAAQYGDTEDHRFDAKVASIDAMLKAGGID